MSVLSCHLVRFYHSLWLKAFVPPLQQEKGKNDYIVIMTRKASVLTWKNSRSRLPRDNRVYRTVAVLLTVGTLMWLFLAYTTSLLSLVVALSPSSDTTIIDGKPLRCLGYTANPKQQFIIFGDPSGQGVGNVMSGLLAVHMLGLEFDRTVCVHPGFASFHAAFEAAADATACARLFECEKPVLGNAGKNSFIRIINFHPPPNECLLQQTLASREHRLLWIEANTYPRWTQTPPQVRFTTYYKPKEALLRILPWKDSNTPPHHVVHLRAPDGTSDIRKGLDDETLEALGKHLPSDTYLVTNKVMWYDWFEEKFGWSHPPWQGVTHSALALSWGDRQGRNIPRVTLNEDEKETRNLELWADWYTILHAKSLFHTHSDFSSSAAHWMNIEDSHVLEFCNLKDGTLQLNLEEWRRHDDNDLLGVAAPLSQRRQDPQLPETQRLEHCDATLPLSGFVGM